MTTAKGTKKQQQAAKIAKLAQRLRTVDIDIHDDYTATFTIMGEAFTMPLTMGLAEVIALTRLDLDGETPTENQLEQVMRFFEQVAGEEVASRVGKLPTPSALALVEAWQGLINEVAGATVGES